MIRVLVLAVCQLFTNGALLSWFFVFAFIENMSSSSAVGMWKSQAAFLPDFSKRLREAMLFVAFRERAISTAGLGAWRFALCRLRVLVILTAVAKSFCCNFSICRLSCPGLSKR